MHYCKFCNYFAKTNNLLHNHYKTNKHIINANLNNTKFICKYCNLEYINSIELTKHSKNCNGVNHNGVNHNYINEVHKLEIELIKKDYQLELEKKQRQLDKVSLELSYEKKLAIKEIENKNLQINNINCINSTINNNIKITKIEYLNLNFSNVIPMSTFIENYKTKYGLNKEETRLVLENFKHGGVNSCINDLLFYIRQSACKQYNEEFDMPITIDKTNVVLPYMLNDMSLREHYEKYDDEKWSKTKVTDNIKKLVTITNDQIYKHQGEYMNFNGPTRKRIINGLLKGSSYQFLETIKPPSLYNKSENILSQKTNQSTTNDSNQSIDLTNNKKKLSQLLNQDDDDNDNNNDDDNDDDNDNDDNDDDNDDDGYIIGDDDDD